MESSDFDNYITRHAVKDIVFTGFNSVPNYPDFLRRCYIQDGNSTFKSEVIAIDLEKKELLRKLNLANEMYFSESPLIVPHAFKLLTLPVTLGTPIDDTVLTGMIKSAVPLGPSTKFNFVHTINKSSGLPHPCLSVTTSSQSKLLSSFMLSEEEEDENKTHGAKACAYILYTANLTFAPLHLIFYFNVTGDAAISKVFSDMFSLVDWNVAIPDTSSRYANPSTWGNVFAIPLLTPSNSIVYHVIPDSSDGRNYLLHWLEKAINCSWVAIDYSHEYIDKWSIYTTLDARIITSKVTS